MSNDTTTTALTGELTNSCTCLLFDEDGETKSVDTEYSETCYGDCWEYAVEDFAMCCLILRNSNETGWWKVSNLRLWDGESSGYFHAKTVADLIDGMTVRGDWTMRYTAHDDRVEYSLSHHDAMGSNTTLTAVTEEQREELGLY